MAQTTRARGVVLPVVLIGATALAGCVASERTARNRPPPPVAAAPAEPAADPGGCLPQRPSASARAA